MKELIKNFFAFGLATVIDKFILFLLLPIYARVFTPEEFGIVDLIQVIVGIISIFAYLQLETSLQRYYYKEPERGKLIFSTSLTIFLISIFLVLIGILFSKSLSSLFFADIKFQNAIIIALLQIPFAVINTINLIVLRFEQKNKEFFISVIVFSISLLVLVFVLIDKYKILGLFYAQLISVIIATIVSTLFVRKYITLSFSVFLIKKSFKYAIPQVPARIGSTANAYANRFLINSFLSIFYLGIFSMALRIGSIILLVHGVFMMAWNQFMFKIIEDPNHKKIFSSIFSIAIPLLFLMVSLITLFSYELIYYVLSPQYIEAYKYTGFIALAYSLLILKEIVDIGPKYKEKTYFLSINFFISVAVNLITLFILVPLIGLLGAVISLALTNLSLLIASWYNSNRLYPINFSIRNLLINTLPLLLLFIFNFSKFSSSLIIKIQLAILLSIFYFFTFYLAFKKYRKPETNI